MLDANLASGMPFSPPPLEVFVVSDASTLGWDCHLEDVEIKGLWSLMEQLHHISLLELQAFRLALKPFLTSIKAN